MVNYIWNITLKKYHVGTGYYMRNGVKEPLDSISVFGFLVHGKNIHEAIKNAEDVIVKNKHYTDCTICDVYCATFNSTKTVVNGSFA